MGLDMYLEKRTDVRLWNFQKPEEQFEVVVKKGGVTYPNINSEKVTTIVEEYQRLLEQKAEDNARELHKKRVAEWRRQRLKNQILDRVLETLLVVFVIGYLICLMWIISLQHRGLLDTF